MEPLSPLAARLLEAARQGHEPTPDELARTLGALHARLDYPDVPGIDGGAMPSAAAAGAIIEPTLGSKIAAIVSGKVVKLTLASLALGGSITGTMVLRGAAPPAPPAPMPIAATAAPIAEETAFEAPVVEPTAALEDRATTPRAARKEGHRSQRELRLIGRALTALRDDRPDRALALLKAHEARFPRGQFITERDGLRVLALCAAGRIDAGTRARERFLQQAEHAPIAARVRLSCQGERSP